MVAKIYIIDKPYNEFFTPSIYSRILHRVEIADIKAHLSRRVGERSLVSIFWAFVGRNLCLFSNSYHRLPDSFIQNA